MKKKMRKRRKETAGASMLRIKTTLDFGEEGIPLERLGEIVKALKVQHLDTVSHATHGFMPIAFDRYVDLHMQSNPAIDREEFISRLRHAVDARKAGARCRCGAFIWAIGSADERSPAALPRERSMRHAIVLADLEDPQAAVAVVSSVTAELFRTAKNDTSEDLRPMAAID